MMVTLVIMLLEIWHVPTLPPAISSLFATLNNLRIDHTKDHALFDIILIAICAIICGLDG